MRFSHTQVSMAQECEQKFCNHYLRKQRPRKRASYFVLGEAIHGYIELYYGTRDIKIAQNRINAVFDSVNTSLLSPEEIHDFQVDKQIALGISSAYPEFYKDDFNEYKTFLCEKEATIPLVDEDTYYMKLDVLMQDHSGAWWIKETKTAAAQTLGSGYFDKIQIDNQVCGQMFGAKSILGEFPSGIVYDVIKKPSIRLKQGESHAAFQKRIYLEYSKFAKEKAYFTRQQVILDKDHMDQWYEEIKYTTSRISSKVKNKEKIWPKNTGACLKWGSPCVYMRACIDRKFNPLIYQKEL